MFNATDAFEVDGLILNGSVALFSVDVVPVFGSYPEAPTGSQCFVPNDGVYTKYSDGSWLRSVDDPTSYEEVVLWRNGEPELCMFHDSMVKVRV